MNGRGALCAIVLPSVEAIIIAILTGSHRSGEPFPRSSCQKACNDSTDCAGYECRHGVCSSVLDGACGSFNGTGLPLAPTAGPASRRPWELDQETGKWSLRID
jgi:hypothetical protein